MSTTVISAFVLRPPKKPRLSHKNDIRENRSRRHFPWALVAAVDAASRIASRRPSIFFLPCKNDDRVWGGVARGWKTRGSHQSFFSRRGNKMSGTGFIWPRTAAIPQKPREIVIHKREAKKNLWHTGIFIHFMPRRCEIQKLECKSTYQTCIGPI